MDADKPRATSGNDELETMPTRKDAILASLSHEFRTPLNSIIGFTGTLLMKLPGPINADQERQLRIIQGSARQLLSLIECVAGVGAFSGATFSSESACNVEYRAELTCQKSAEEARILLIDDDPNGRKLMAFLLNAFGYELLIAEDGERGLAMARLEAPDLILCDLQLPKLDGYEIARELKRDPALRHIPLVAFTASAPIGSQDKTRMGTFDYSLAKPIHHETLAGQLACFLAGGALRS